MSALRVSKGTCGTFALTTNWMRSGCERLCGYAQSVYYYYN